MFNMNAEFTLPGLVMQYLALCDVFYNLCAVIPGYLQAGHAVTIMQPWGGALVKKSVEIYRGGKYDIKTVWEFIFTILTIFFRICAVWVW